MRNSGESTRTAWSKIISTRSPTPKSQRTSFFYFPSSFPFFCFRLSQFVCVLQLVKKCCFSPGAKIQDLDVAAWCESVPTTNAKWTRKLLWYPCVCQLVIGHLKNPRLYAGQHRYSSTNNLGEGSSSNFSQLIWKSSKSNIGIFLWRFTREG